MFYSNWVLFIGLIDVILDLIFYYKQQRNIITYKF